MAPDDDNRGTDHDRRARCRSGLRVGRRCVHAARELRQLCDLGRQFRRIARYVCLSCRLHSRVRQLQRPGGYPRSVGRRLRGRERGDRAFDGAVPRPLPRRHDEIVGLRRLRWCLDGHGHVLLALRTGHHCRHLPGPMPGRSDMPIAVPNGHHLPHPVPDRYDLPCPVPDRHHLPDAVPDRHHWHHRLQRHHLPDAVPDQRRHRHHRHHLPPAVPDRHDRLQRHHLPDAVPDQGRDRHHRHHLPHVVPDGRMPPAADLRLGLPAQDVLGDGHVPADVHADEGRGLPLSPTRAS